MNDRIRGTFPGGPSRRGSEPAASARPRLETVEQLEQASAARSLRRSRTQRRRRDALAMRKLLVDRNDALGRR